METVQIGPFYVNWSLLSGIIAAVAAYAAVALVIRRTEWRSSSLMDLIFNTMVIGFLGWKLAPYVLQPAMIWRSPLKGLLMQGGLYAILIGAAAATLYLFIRGFRSQLPLRLIMDALGYGAAILLAVRALIGGARYGSLTDLPWGITLSDPAYRYHPIHIYELLLAISILLIFAIRRIWPGPGRAGELFCLVGGGGLIAISLVMTGESAAMLLTVRQWLMLLLCVIGLILPRLYILWDDTRKKELDSR